MKFDVNFSDLHLAVAQMDGLEKLVNTLRDQGCSYQDGLSQAKAFTKANQGSIESLEDGITRLTVDGFTVDCFQPYPDIDRFYFEY